ncbi:MAG: hypothetical protein IJY58_00455, partial [Alphaproteobacteria bacterium]|nr:hypothetical protein [Alphaproteobacteria bacterium]
MEILNAFFNGYFKQKTPETGRSMVEILGVLAVMGVLSAGGIYGYTFAMDKYRANDIVYEVNLRANDVWHKYQEQPLPDPSEDGTDFDEFPDMTGTGYPIYMTSHPDVAFKTYVEGVSSRVCKNVVNMNLNGIVQGIRYVQVAQGDGDLVKYTGDASICGEDETDNTIVFTSFLDSENNEAGTGQSGDPCVEDMDCTSPCGNASCDIDKMTCKNSCTGTANPFCFDNGETGTCVECMVNQDCPNEQICDLTNHKCVDIPKTCGEGDRFGKEYRVANGSCVQCGFQANMILQNANDNDGIFQKTVGHIAIKDTHSGIDMCQACGNEKRIAEVGEGDNQVTYCATTCIRGKEFLTTQYGCLPCFGTHEKIQNPGSIHVQTDLETYGQWSALTMPNDAQAKMLCNACGNRVVYDGKCVLKECPTGYHKSGGICRKCHLNKVNNTDCFSGNWSKCHDNYTPLYNTTLSDELKKSWQNECTQNCSGKQIYVSGGKPFCSLTCQENEFLSAFGTCYPCSTPEIVDLVGIGSYTAQLEAMCRACKDERGYPNRKYADGKCVLDMDVCPTGYFMDENKTCYPCSEQKPVIITNDDASGCTKCNVPQEEQGYTNVTKRWVMTWQGKNYCLFDCGSDYMQMYDTGVCKKCSELGTMTSIVAANPTSLPQEFMKMCADCSTDTKTYSLDNGSVKRFCSLTTCPKNTYRAYNGQCVSCSLSGDYGPNYGFYTQVDSQKDCQACDNRMYVDGYCLLYQPGDYGVCNSDSPDPENFPNYPSGMGKLYRDVDWVCRSCTADASYKTTKAECESCGDLRQFNESDSYCFKAGCEETVTFLASNNRCQSCVLETAIEIADEADSKQLCTACGNRRIM